MKKVSKFFQKFFKIPFIFLKFFKTYFNIFSPYFFESRFPLGYIFLKNFSILFRKLFPFISRFIKISQCFSVSTSLIPDSFFEIFLKFIRRYTCNLSVALPHKPEIFRNFSRNSCLISTKFLKILNSNLTISQKIIIYKY